MEEVEPRLGKMTNSELVERHPLKEKRRANKPLLERKRRARINDSLRDLKSLVLSSLNKDVSKFSKMEKVDVLDMTVQYLKGAQIRPQPRKDDCADVYQAGFSECTNELIRQVMSMPLDQITRTKLLNFLAQNQMKMQQVSRSQSPPPSPTCSHVSSYSTSSGSSGYASDSSHSPVPSSPGAPCHRPVPSSPGAPCHHPVPSSPGAPCHHPVPSSPGAEHAPVHHPYRLSPLHDSQHRHQHHKQFVYEPSGQYVAPQAPTAASCPAASIHPKHTAAQQQRNDVPHYHHPSSAGGGRTAATHSNFYQTPKLQPNNYAPHSLATSAAPHLQQVPSSASRTQQSLLHTPPPTTAAVPIAKLDSTSEAPTIGSMPAAYRLGTTSSSRSDLTAAAAAAAAAVREQKKSGSSTCSPDSSIDVWRPW